MFHKIKSVIPANDHVILAIYRNGEMRSFDIDILINKYPVFKKLKDDPILFDSVRVDVGGYGIIWNDELDLSAEGIYENGKVIDGSDYYKSIVQKIIETTVEYRKKNGLSQKDVSNLSGVAQPAIARIEKGKSDPQLSTFVRLLSSMGLKIDIVKA